MNIRLWTKCRLR